MMIIVICRLTWLTPLLIKQLKTGHPGVDDIRDCPTMGKPPTFIQLMADFADHSPSRRTTP